MIYIILILRVIKYYINNGGVYLRHWHKYNNSFRNQVLVMGIILLISHQM